MDWLQTLAAISSGIRQGQEDTRKSRLEQEETAFNKWRRQQLVNNAMLEQARDVQNQAWQGKQRAFEENSMVRKEKEWGAIDQAKKQDRVFVQPFETGMMNSFTPDGQRTLTVPTPAPAMDFAGKAASLAGGMAPIIPFGTSLNQVQPSTTLTGVKTQKDFEEDAADQRYINKTIAIKEKLADEGLIRDYDRFPLGAKGGTGKGRASSFSPPASESPVGQKYTQYLSQGLLPKEAYKNAAKDVTKGGSGGKEMKKLEDIPDEYKEIYFNEHSRLAKEAKDNQTPENKSELEWRSLQAVKKAMAVDQAKAVEKKALEADADQELKQELQPSKPPLAGNLSFRGAVPPFVPDSGNRFLPSRQGVGELAGSGEVAGGSVPSSIVQPFSSGIEKLGEVAKQIALPPEPEIKEPGFLDYLTAINDSNAKVRAIHSAMEELKIPLDASETPFGVFQRLPKLQKFAVMERFNANLKK